MAIKVGSKLCVTKYCGSNNHPSLFRRPGAIWVVDELQEDGRIVAFPEETQPHLGYNLYHVGGNVYKSQLGTLLFSLSNKE